MIVITLDQAYDIWQSSIYNQDFGLFCDRIKGYGYKIA